MRSLEGWNREQRQGLGWQRCSGKVWGGTGSSGELCQHCDWRPAGKQASSPPLRHTLEARWSGCATTAEETFGLTSQRHMLGVGGCAIVLRKPRQNLQAQGREGS